MLLYLSRISRGRMVLWCYLIWYLVTVFFHFDPSPRLWLNSAGISLVIGIALMLSVSHNAEVKPDRWQTFRLFLMPLCVSSFSSLIKNAGYVIIFPPRPLELLVSVGACAVFVGCVALVKWRDSRLQRTSSLA